LDSCEDPDMYKPEHNRGIVLMPAGPGRLR